MGKLLKWRIFLMLAVLVATVVYALPTFTDNLSAWWPAKKVNSGLDIQEGTYLVLEVDLDEAVDNRVAQLTDDFRRSLADGSISVVKVAKGEEPTISARFPDEDSLKAATGLLTENYPQLLVNQKDGLHLTLALTPEAVVESKKLTTEQALEIISNRVNLFGAPEADIRLQGENRIIIQLPGLDDPERVKELIGKPALLEFKIVDETQTAEWALENGIPAGLEVLYGRETGEDGEEIKVPYLLRRIPVMTGEGLADTRMSPSGNLGTPEVSITFDSRGARQFERITGEYLGRRMAIIIDDMVYSAPTIGAKIKGGRAVISGTFSEDEARNLALALRTGALPASVDIVEERTVGADQR